MGGRLALVIASECAALGELGFTTELGIELYTSLSALGGWEPATTSKGPLLDPTVYQLHSAVCEAFEAASHAQATLLISFIGNGVATSDEDYYFLAVDSPAQYPDSYSAFNVVQAIREQTDLHSIDGLIVLVDACETSSLVLGASRRWAQLSNIYAGRVELLVASGDGPAYAGCFTRTMLSTFAKGIPTGAKNLMPADLVQPIAMACLRQQPRHMSFNPGRADPAIWLVPNVVHRAPDDQNPTTQIMRLPDGERSRAVLIGTSLYRTDSGFDQLPSVTKSLTEFGRVLREQTELPSRNVTVVPDPAEHLSFIKALRPAATEAEDLLLFYFVGHGVSLRNNDLGLTHTQSDLADPDWTTVSYQLVRDAILNSSAQIKVVILDCCHSGRAFGANTLAGIDPSKALEEIASINGSYVLTATDKKYKFAAAVGELGCTAFTGALIQAIRGGPPNGSGFLTLETVYQRTRKTLGDSNLPIPQASGRNTASTLALARTPSGSS